MRRIEGSPARSCADVQVRLPQRASDLGLDDRLVLEGSRNFRLGGVERFADRSHPDPAHPPVSRVVPPRGRRFAGNPVRLRLAFGPLPNPRCCSLLQKSSLCGELRLRRVGQGVLTRSLALDNLPLARAWTVATEARPIKPTTSVTATATTAKRWRCAHRRARVGSGSGQALTGSSASQWSSSSANARAVGYRSPALADSAFRQTASRAGGTVRG